MNGARGLSIIADWGVLVGDDGIYLNYYGPGSIEATTANGETWSFRQETDYPADGKVRIHVTPGKAGTQTLHVRIPAWSKQTKVTVNGQAVAGAVPGQYLAIKRAWIEGDVIEIDLDMSLHTLSGDGYVDFRGSLYKGPLLLAYDQKYNAFDPAAMPKLDLARMDFKPIETDARFQPMALYEVTAEDGQPVRLVDFASAGAHGTFYQSWLPIDGLAPVAINQMRPGNGDALPPGEVYLQWTGAGPDATSTLTIARDPALNDVVERANALDKTAHFVSLAVDTKTTFFWSIAANGPNGSAPSANGPFSFTIDPDRPPAEAGLILDVPLHGRSAATVGSMTVNEHARAIPGRDGQEKGALYFDGTQTKLVYEIGAFPVRNYSFAAWMAPDNLAANESDWHHVFSAWSQGSDDPLRVSVQNKRLVANIEQSTGGYHLGGPELNDGEWIHVVVVKEATSWRLYINGALAAETKVPEELKTSATNVGLGCNPNLGHLEGYQGAIADVRLYASALTDAAIQRLAAGE